MEHEAEIAGIGVGMGAEGGVPAVILRAREEYVPIFVTDDQAHSIEMALEGEPFERPLTHDLMLDFVTELGGALDRVRIDDLADGTFYAKVDIERYDEGESKKFVFDARPSDSVALAVRAECPVVITDEVLDEAGRDPEELKGPPEGEEFTSGIGGAGRASKDPFGESEQLDDDIKEEIEERLEDQLDDPVDEEFDDEDEEN